MPVTVAVNTRTVVHKASEGVAVGFPDACLTPPDGRVILYLNAALSRDAAGTCASVFCDGHAVIKKSSYFATSYGDELGSLGGVISGTFKGKASFITSSPDVFFEGEPAPRADDYVEGNHGSPSNVLLGRWIQKIFESFPWEKVVLCAAICFCNSAGQREWCVRWTLSTPRRTKPGKGSSNSPQSSFIHDPRVPGIYHEVTFVPGRRKKPPWVPVLTKQKNAAGVPIPSSDYIPGSIRPDVVVAKDPLKPLTPDNVKAVYEIKFPGDSLSERQEREYQDIAGTKRFEVLDVNTCNCSKYGPPPREIPLPKWEKLKEPAREKNWWDELEVPLPRPLPRPVPNPVPVPQPVPGPRPVPFPRQPAPAPGMGPIFIPDSFWDWIEEHGPGNPNKKKPTA